MESGQIVTLTFFRYSSFGDKWWAFKLMGQGLEQLQKVEGLSFVKMLGSGSGNGFSIWPNFGTYGLLAVWERESYAQQFFADDELFNECKARSAGWWTTYMQAAHFHGQWDGSCPFEESVAYDKQRLVAVITRATIATSKLWQFWRFVPQVGRAVEEEPGLIFSVGVGELPLVQQATFSLWENSEQMMAYAYRSPYHKEVVRKTRELGWYTEEMFARFHPYQAEGEWQDGNTPLSQYLPAEDADMK